MSGVERERLAPVPDEILDHFAPDRPMTVEDIDAAGAG